MDGKMEMNFRKTIFKSTTVMLMLIVLLLTASKTDAAGQGRDTECDPTSTPPKACDPDLGLFCLTEGAKGADATKPDTGTAAVTGPGKCFCGGTTTFWHETPAPGKCDVAGPAGPNTASDSPNSNDTEPNRFNMGAGQLPRVSVQHFLVLGITVFFFVNFFSAF